MLGTILLVFAFVFACIAAASIPTGRFAAGWVAFAFYIASLLFGHLIR
jgi:hypothetical protein